MPAPAEQYVSLTCPQGHSWQSYTNVAVGLASSTSCPVCGELPSSLANTAIIVGSTRQRFEKPTIPGFELLEELGQGGMGVVYKARQEKPERTVAIKFMRPAILDEESLASRFRSEANAIARLEHPNIVRVYAVGETDGLSYIALEFIDGPNLADRLERERMQLDDSVRMIATLARAVHFAHQRQIVHRDLKPANVLIAPDGTPKLTDFGLAKRLDSDLKETRTGEIVGTVSYMAPEQTTGVTHNIGPACDIHALGVILYELTTGHRPYCGKDVIDTLSLVATADPMPPRRLSPIIPRDLETICLKCLEKQPRRRYATAADLADDLDRMLKLEPIHARPAGPFEKAAKWSRRRPAAALALVVAVLAPLIIAGGLAWHSHRIGQELALTQTQRSRAEFNLARTQDKLDELLEDVGTGRLASLPRASSVRTDLLEWGLALCKELQSRNPDNAHLQLQAARAQRQMADIERLLGRTDTSRKSYDAAVEQLQLVSQTPSATPDFRRELAAALNNRGLLSMDDGETASAREDINAAVALLRKLHSEYPKEIQFTSRLASTLTNLGLLLQSRGESAEADNALVEASQLHQRLAYERPQDPAALLALAQSEVNLGRLQVERAQLTEAQDMLERAIVRFATPPLAGSATLEMRYARAAAQLNLVVLQHAAKGADAATIHEALAGFEQLVQEQPERVQFREGLSAALRLQAIELARSGDQRQAEELLLRALKVQTALVAQLPQRFELRSQLGLLEQTAGEVLAAREDWPDAKVHFRNAIAEQRMAVDAAGAPLVYRLRLRDHYLALSRLALKQGEPTDAALAADELAAAFADQPDELVQAADLLAQCIPLAEILKGQGNIHGQPLTQYCSTRAATLVRKALAAGTPAEKLPKNLAPMLTGDADLQKQSQQDKK